jgi:protein gp37
MGVAARFSDAGQPYEGLAKFSSKRRLPQWTGKVRLVPEHLADPLRWTKPRRIFANSMSDLFHEELSNEAIAAVFGVMAAAPQHTFQVLTKRARRMREWFDWISREKGARQLGLVLYHAQLLCEHRVLRKTQPILSQPWPLPNVWLGVSTEDQHHAYERIPELLRTPAAVRFVSYEPALGPIDFASFLPPKLGTCGHEATTRCRHSLANSDAAVDWIIIGGESGPHARPFDVAWASSVVKQCADAGVACFVKQMGRVVMGDDDGFEVDAWYFGEGRWWRPGIIGEHNRGRPTKRRGFESDAIGFTLFDKKGGDMTEWPKSLRVREFPRLERAPS